MSGRRRHRRHGSRTTARVLLGDQVLPTALTDPRRQAVRDRRWTKLTAQGSLMMAGFFGVIAQFFNGTKPEVVAEQQMQARGNDGALQPDESPGAAPFACTIRLTRNDPPAA